MTQTQHTPGPWAVETPNDHQNIIVSAAGETIALGVSDTNARLIAAAPELLGALKEVVGQLEDVRREKRECWKNERVNMVSAFLHQAHTVIAKAEGR